MEGSRLYVGNLNYACTEEQLKELFSDHGEVKDVRIIEGRGFGFVEMGSPDEAEAAKQALDDSEFLGRKLKVNEAYPPRNREQ
jgi:RNA recognition motif-containing protein